jgi:transposase
MEVFMYVVGVDVSKGKSMISVLKFGGTVVTSPYEIRHTNSDLIELIQSIKNLEGETRVILEYTGRYYEPIANSLNNAGIFVCAVNPLLINQFGNNSLRKVKTDKADSLKIARFGLDNWVHLRKHTDMEKHRKQLNMLNRQFNLYSKNKTALKNNLIALLDTTFPGVNRFFDSSVRDDGRQKWVDFANTYWHVDCVRSLSEKVFVGRYQKWCKKNGYLFNSAKATKIYAESKELVPTLSMDDYTKLLVTEAITQLNAISKSVETFRSAMNLLASQLPEYPVVMSMCGVGETLGPQLMAEIGDVLRFEHRGSLVAFAGVDPSPSQSGNYERQHNPISKRGSPHLRCSLF